MRVFEKATALLLSFLLILSLGSNSEVYAAEGFQDSARDSGGLFGYEPPPFDTSNLLFGGNAGKHEALRATSQPAKYCLVKDSGNSVDEITPELKDQGRWGACWTFSALGSAESSLYQNGSNDVDFSERHLAYFTYQGTNNPDKPEDGTKNDTFLTDTSGDSAPFMSGGNFFKAIATLSRGVGVEAEEKVPYPTKEDFLDNNAADFNQVEEEYHFASHYQLREANFLPNRDAYGNLNGSEIKKALMNGNSVGVSYCADSASYHLVDGVKYPTYYNGTEKTSNHAVQIVGWDDDIARTAFTDKSGNHPSLSGAWLIRNTWGMQSASRGGTYFYLSYEDQTVSMLCSLVMDKTPQDSPRYAHNYQYDGAGQTATIGDLGKQGSMANIFTATGDQTLKAVAFYTTGPGASYSIQVYTGLTDTSSPVNGTKAFLVEQSGAQPYAGYHTVDLERAVPLMNGERFSVVITTMNSTARPVALENNIPGYSSVGISKGQSFFKGNVFWQDLATVATSGNACIKAFTNDKSAEPEITVAPENAFVKRGQSQQFTALVSGTNDQGVTWTVSGNASASTVISEDGSLTVAGNETAPSLTVRAALKANPEVFDEACVMVITPAPAEKKTVRFYNLKSTVKMQTVSVGSPRSSVTLPNTLSAIVNGSPNIEVPVLRWESSPSFSSAAEGTFVFRPVLAEEYFLEDPGNLPAIKVTVVKKSSGGGSWRPRSGGGGGGGGSGGGAAVTAANTVAITQNGIGTSVVVTVEPDSAAAVTNHIALLSATGAFYPTTAQNNATAQNHARIEFMLPNTAVLSQLNNADVTAVELSVKIPHDAVYNTNPYVDIMMNLGNDILQTARAMKKDIIVSVVDTTAGRPAYQWVFSGSLPAGAPVPLSGVNLALNIKSTSLDAEVSAAVPSAGKGTVLIFADNGVLPTPATVKVYVGDQGYTAEQVLYLYYYNPVTKGLETVSAPVSKVDQSGYASVTISHCSRYVLLPQQILSASSVILDTGKSLKVRAGKSYQIMATASTAPSITSANGSVFQVKKVGSKGGRYYFQVTAVGKKGSAAGLYVNGEKTPRIIASVV